jgi:hypothetical protein
LKSPVCWVVKEQMLRSDTGSTPMDYGHAMEFGEIEFITTHDMPLHPRSQVQDAWDQAVVEFARRYDSQRDYIVCTGQPIAILTIGYALGRAGKWPRFLVWRREENRYRVVQFNGDRIDTSIDLMSE